MNVRRVVAAVLALLCAGHLSTSAQEPQNDSRPRLPIVGRSVVSTTFGIVAASQPLAARAGVQILERGGNAIDAAIAANATIGLMEPTGNGLGGDLFIIYYEAKSGTVYGLNSSGWAPTGLTPDYLAAKGIKEMPQRGIYSVTVPGVAAGWDAMRTRFGTKPFSELLAPAIYYAENGFPLSETIARSWSGSEKMLLAHPNSSSHVFDRRQARAEGGRDLPQSRSRRLAAPDRREGPRRLLQRQDRRSDRRDLARTGRHVHDGRPRPNSSPSGSRRSRPAIAAGTSTRSARRRRAFPR